MCVLFVKSFFTVLREFHLFCCLEMTLCCLALIDVSFCLHINIDDRFLWFSDKNKITGHFL